MFAIIQRQEHGLALLGCERVRVLLEPQAIVGAHLTVVLVVQPCVDHRAQELGALGIERGLLGRVGRVHHGDRIGRVQAAQRVAERV